MKKIPFFCLLMLIAAFSVAQKQTGKSTQAPKKTQSKKRPSTIAKPKTPLSIKGKSISIVSDSKTDIHKEIEPASQNGNLIFSDPEEMATYPGGEDSLMNYFINNLHYPIDARDNEIQGRVVVSFEVCSDGRLCNYKVERSVSPSLDSEAVRVIRNMQKWEPAKMKGTAVPSYYTLPVMFQLND